MNRSTRKRKRDSSAEFLELCKQWVVLRLGIEMIFNEQKLPVEQYMTMYTMVHEFCSNCDYTPARKVARVADGRAMGRLTADNLYKQIRGYIKQYLSGMDLSGFDSEGEDLLSHYVSTWKKFQRSCKILRNVCADLNKYTLRRKRTDNRAAIRGVYQLAMTCWSNYFCEFAHERLIPLILGYIELERKGGIINTTLLHNVIKSFIDLSVAKNDLTPEEDLWAYQDYFEAIFLIRTREFYVGKSAEFLRDNSPDQYMKMIETVFLQERQRVGLYLHKSSMKPLIFICEAVLIADQLDVVLANFKNLLIEGNIPTLKRVYQCLRKTLKSVEALYEIYEEFVDETGKNAIAALGEKSLTYATAYVGTILQVYKANCDMVKEAFGDSNDFILALNNGCNKFVNNNSVTRMDDPPSTKTPELIARHCDIVLKKVCQNRDDDSVEEILNEIIVVFKFIDDKDIFIKYYTKLVAKRHVQQTLTNFQAEVNLIKKLALVCGQDYTLKLRRMFIDVHCSYDQMRNFREKLSQSGMTDTWEFNVFTLDSKLLWFQQSLTFTLPKELQTRLDMFTQYYSEEFKRRKLIWFHQLSIAELVSSCFQSKYTFKASVTQMVLLLQYNINDVFTVERLQELTQMKQEYLIQVLQTLLQSTLLTCDDDHENLNPNSVIRLFLGYNCIKSRVNLNVPLKADVKGDQEATVKFIEQDRNILIQAAIVRIMKEKTECQHLKLFAEIYKQLSLQFKPKVSAVKKCIEWLIAKEYLCRVTGKDDTYKYLS